MITVLGSSGFIGSNIVKHLKERNLECYCPDRYEDYSNIYLGDVIYCIGLTADFRLRPMDTVEAHVSKLLKVIKRCRYDSLLYLSSTRLYNHCFGLARENDSFHVNPLDFSDLYNISKLMGESLTLAAQSKMKIARLSNVYGNDYNSDNFLSSIIKEAISNGKVTFHSSPGSVKDYVNVDSVAKVLVRILLESKYEIYNVASGINTSNYDLANIIGSITGCEIEYVKNAVTVNFPQICIDRIKQEFEYNPVNVLNDLPKLLEIYKENRRVWDDDQN